jgi:RecB family endonuclease NucS
MKKSELKAINKTAKKVLKTNLEESLLATIKQTAAKLGTDTKKTEKKLAKNINKLSKKITKLITPVQGAKPKATDTITKTPVAPINKAAPKTNATEAETVTISAS